MLWMFITYVCLGVHILRFQVVTAQDVLAVSSFQSCTAVSYGTTQLACSETENTVTVLVVRTRTTTTPDGGGGDPTTFEFKVASLPPTRGTSTGSSSNLRCTQTDASNQCGASQRISVTVQAQPPVRRFRLREMPAYSLPFSYYFSLVDGGCSTKNCFNERSSKYPCTSANEKDCCIYQGSSKSQSQNELNKLVPTPELIQQWFANTRHGRNGLQPGDPIACPTRYPDDTPYTPPNGNVTNPGSTILEYNFLCNGKSVQFYAAFYQLGPMCRAFRVEQSEVVGRINVTATDTEGKVRSVIINTAQYETAGVTPEGDMLVRVLNVQSATDTLSETLPGILVMCGDSVPAVGAPDQLEVPLIDMFPKPPSEGLQSPEADVLINPWSALPDEMVEYTYPTPPLINAVRGSELPAPNQFYFYLENEEALNVGTGCGQLGVSPDYYLQMTQQVQYDTYIKRVGSSPKFPYSKIRTLDILNTCVPEFGLSFRGRNVTTPCSAVSYFHNQNQGTVEQRKARALGEQSPRNLPRGFNVARQNVALQNNYMYIYQSLDAQWEVSIAMRAELLGVVSKPFTGTISTTQFTGCALQQGNANSAGTVAAYVCSGVPQDSLKTATYVVYAECDQASGLLVQTSTALTIPLSTGKCELITFNLLELFAPLDGTQRFCHVYLGAANAQPVFGPDNSLILDAASLLCEMSNLGSNFSLSNLLLDPADALTLSNATIVSRKNYTPPEPPETDTAWYVWGFLSLVIGLIALCILGCSLFFWARTKLSAPAKLKVVD